MALAAAAQDRRVARLEAQRARVAGHVRPALVDDADHAERHAHALDAQAVRPLPLGDHRADRVRQRRDLLDACAPSPRRAPSSRSRSSIAARGPPRAASDRCALAARISSCAAAQLAPPRAAPHSSARWSPAPAPRAAATAARPIGAISFSCPRMIKSAPGRRGGSSRRGRGSRATPRARAAPAADALGVQCSSMRRARGRFRPAGVAHHDRIAAVEASGTS
jgi:hypothetical protein